MTQPAPHGQPGTQEHFTDEEWDQIQAADRSAATMVLGLITAIFTIGLVLYFIIAMIVL
jgi:hypothetical protein